VLDTTGKDDPVPNGGYLNADIEYVDKLHLAQSYPESGLKICG
jgi:hypothetical protein